MKVNIEDVRDLILELEEELEREGYLEGALDFDNLFYGDDIELANTKHKQGD